MVFSQNLPTVFTPETSKKPINKAKTIPQYKLELSSEGKRFLTEDTTVFICIKFPVPKDAATPQKANKKDSGKKAFLSPYFTAYIVPPALPSADFRRYKRLI